VKLLRLLLPLLPTLLGLLPEARQGTLNFGRRLALNAELVAVAVVLIATAFGFAVAAAYMVLAAALTPHAAAAIMALGLDLLAGLAVVALLAVNRAGDRRRAQALNAAREQALAPLNELGRQIGARPLQSLAIAAAVGMVTTWLGRRR
jgi:hypothetical protein